MAEKNSNNYDKTDYISQGSLSQFSLNYESSISQATCSPDYNSQNSLNYNIQSDISSKDSDVSPHNGDVTYKKQDITSFPYNQFNTRYLMPDLNKFQSVSNLFF